VITVDLTTLHDQQNIVERFGDWEGDTVIGKRA